MAADRLNIDTATLFDNVDERRVEFRGTIGDDTHGFAVPYDTLRALTGEDPVTEPVATLRRVADRIATAATTALARDAEPAMVMVSENDL